MFRKTLIAAALATATFAAGASQASATDLNTAISGSAPITQAAVAADGAAGFKSKVRFKKRFKFKFRKHFKHYGGQYGYGYGKRCYWLKKKAYRTGSHYWWAKYKRCMYRFY